MAKKNPLNLNPLQLKTLTLFQHLARQPDAAMPVDGGVEIGVPHPHGNHFHLGDAVVASRDATGLTNEAAWVVLARKGLIESFFPARAIVTKAGLDYETGLSEQILHRSDH